jgi:hypothetical protein
MEKMQQTTSKIHFIIIDTQNITNTTLMDEQMTPSLADMNVTHLTKHSKLA